ncbi:Maf family protein [Sphingosinicella rhizophila]|uniref:Nucleoside triphosphate pyrophosphatase n=1 Tax=Sphingosinicella rhizophila TaxID=3050082 RepID=A0ABU3Q846_9SPHN|nr:Maf family protein [Sphingosinicella sp. GR2756]MDT9599551.1 Maf family protein [Sphingosinicella sp. GR2756]
MTLLLASRSAARRSMLEAAGLAFDTVESALDEAAAKAGLAEAGFSPAVVAEELAQLKALSVRAAPGDLVLGADQILEQADGRLLSKPESRDDAFAQLRSLSGTTHKLHSAAVIVENGVVAWSHVETSALTMRRLSDAFLESYLDREFDAIRWSVGGYRIEGPGVQLFDRVEGSHFAILGLPLLPLLAYLRARALLPS